MRGLHRGAPISTASGTEPHDLAEIRCPQHAATGLHYTRAGIAYWNESVSAHVLVESGDTRRRDSPPPGYAWELRAGKVELDEEYRVTYHFEPILSRVEDLKLHRHARRPRDVKRKVLGPIPGGRWWGVGEVARHDLPLGCEHETPRDAWVASDWVKRMRCSRPGSGGHMLSVRLWKLFSVGCRVYFYPMSSDPHREFFFARAIEDPVVSVAYLDDTYPWAAYVLGFRGGLELPPVSMLRNE